MLHLQLGIDLAVPLHGSFADRAMLSEWMTRVTQRRVPSSFVSSH